LRLVIDCDPGCDDAVALWLALATPGLEISAITTVAGNVSAALGAANARRVLDFSGRDLPVIAGPERAVPDAVVHGSDGLAGLDLPAPSRSPDAGDAIATLAAAETIIALGPLSNVAAALDRGARPRRLVWMGGAIGPGNATPTAEYNAHCDGAAARRVLEAGLDPVIVPWDAALQAMTTDARLALLHGRVGVAAARLLRAYRASDMAALGTEGGALPDPLAVAALTDPELFAIRAVAVRVAADGTTSFGAAGEGPPARLVEHVDAETFFALLAARLARL
jgi:purine nucleosidase